MKDTKLVNILRTLTRDEMKDFEKFAASPFHNHGRSYFTPLVRELKKFHPGFDSDKLTYENLYRKVKPGKKFNQQVMWNIASATEKMAEEFIAQLGLREDNFGRMRYIVLHYKGRNLKSHYAGMLRTMEKFCKTQKDRYNYFYYLSELERLWREYHHLEDKQYLLSENMLKFGEYQVLLFLKSISYTINDLFTNAEMYNAKYELNIPAEFVRNLNLKGVIEYVRNGKYEHSCLIETYCYSILTNLEPEEPEHFFNMKRLFQENQDKFSSVERPSIAASLVNYCTTKIVRGNSEYKKVSFELYKYFLDQKMALLPYGHLPQMLYLAILKAALAVSEIEWAKKFIEEYTPRLKKEFQKNMRLLALASLNFSLKKYESALQNLNEVDFMDAKDKIIVKIMTAKTYYEMREAETLRYNIDSAKHFISKNKSVGEVRKKSYVNFYNTLTKMISLSENGDKSSVGPFIDAVKNTGELTEKAWILEKLNDLK